MKIIDSHCHPYVEDFREDVEQVLDRARAIGVEKFYMPAIDSSYHTAMLELEARHPDSCKSMMGLHPCSVQKESYQKELNIVEQWLDKRAFAALGEIGLDFYWDKSTIEEQKSSFDIQMHWALERQLPIVIHSRDSIDTAIEMVRPLAQKGLKGIFHCFGGTAEEAKAITDFGFLLGIGGVFTFKKADMPTHLKDISLEHMVLETDSPYLAPVPMRGKRNESSYLQYIIKALAAAKQVTEETVSTITTKNAENLFKM